MNATSPTISGTDLLGRLSQDAQQELAEGEASVHHLKGRNEGVRVAWHAIGIASVRLRNEAMRMAGTNAPVGTAYNRTWKALADTKPGLRDLDKRDRAHAMWLVDHWSLVNTWLATLGSEAAKLLHPTSIMRRYEATHKPPVMPAAGVAVSQRQAADRKIIELQEEVDLLRKRSGGGFMPSATVDELADKIADAHNWQFLEKLAARLLELATANARQDAIEAKAKRKR